MRSNVTRITQSARDLKPIFVGFAVLEPLRFACHSAPSLNEMVVCLDRMRSTTLRTACKICSAMSSEWRVCALAHRMSSCTVGCLCRNFIGEATCGFIGDRLAEIKNGICGDGL